MRVAPFVALILPTFLAACASALDNPFTVFADPGQYEFLNCEQLAAHHPVAHGLERGFHRWEKTVLALAWIAPVVARALAAVTYLPLGFFALTAVFIMIVVRVRSEQVGLPESSVDAPDRRCVPHAT